MAVVEIWQREEIPQGRVVVPSGENSLAEQFGRGLQDLGQAGTQLAFDIQRAKQIKDQRDWQAEQPKIAQDLAQAGLDWTQAYSDMKEKAPADLAGFQDEVASWGGKRREELLKKYSGEKAGDYINLHFAELMRQYGSTAIVDSTEAKYKVIGTSMQSALDTAANNIALNPNQYDLGRKSMIDMVEAASVPESFKAEWRTRIEHSLSGALIGGRLNDNDAVGALNLIESGLYNDRLAPEDLADLKRQAGIAIKVEEAERQRQQNEAVLTNRAAGLPLIDQAISTAKATGKQSLVSDNWLRNTYGGTPAGDQFVETTKRKIREAETQGQLWPTVSSNDPTQNDALVASLMPKPGEAITREQAETLDLASRLVAEKTAAFSGDDPGSAASTYNQQVQKWWAKWQADPTNKPFLKTAMAMSLLEQERQGVPIWKRKAMPESMAQSVAGTIMQQSSPKAKLDALLQFANLGDQESSRSVLAQISKHLPPGVDLAIDVADPLGDGRSGNPGLAEKVLSALATDTSGVELFPETKNAIGAELKRGMGGVLEGQAAVTGNLATTAELIEPLTVAAEQVAKAKIRGGTDKRIAGKQAVADLTSQYATISNPSLAQVYYPRAMEARSPDAVEDGLWAAREAVSEDDLLRALGPTQEMYEPGDPKLADLLETVRDTAVWVNERNGFALYIPGQTVADIDGAPRYLTFMNYEEAERGGLGLQRQEAVPPPLPSTPADFIPIEDLGK
jgi:hypothetical protein